MVRVYSIIDISVVVFLIVQIVDASSSELYYCPMCGFPKYNPYNSLSQTCSCLNHKNYQNSVCPTNTPCPYYSAQNTDKSCLSASGLPTGHIIGSSSDCGRFPYDIQVPPNVHPAPAKLSYPYVAEDPPSPCKQTLQNFGYQLQVPVAHRRDSNYGSLNGIIDKTYKKCPPCPCKLLY
ncbi:uncharacterized protein LOC132949799 [Metopolophium dirhodum]|uniref:uncharacterized protein LOC132949799 n=1 Tax=Metopolophium dirhodum TaxID=44670 RepID=UPI00298FF61D|nr:uncharacterized protein LOC132949799 [Metopolophium dirhodum]